MLFTIGTYGWEYYMQTTYAVQLQWKWISGYFLLCTAMNNSQVKTKKMGLYTLAKFITEDNCSE